MCSIGQGSIGRVRVISKSANRLPTLLMRGLMALPWLQPLLHLCSPTTRGEAAELGRYDIAESAPWLRSFPLHETSKYNIASYMEFAQALKSRGVGVVGYVDSKLAGNVSQYAQSPSTKRSQHQRQTELEWNSDCEAIFNDFEKNLKPNIETLQDTKYRNRRLVFFHNFLDSSQIHRPAQGRHTVIIIIQEGQGFPLISEGSHTRDIASITSKSMIAIPQAKGAVVVFNAGIACQYPAVKGSGGYGIILLY